MTATTAAPGPGSAPPLLVAGAEPAALGETVPEAGGVWPETLLPRAELAERARVLPVANQHPNLRAARRLGTGVLLAWLETWPGQSWQERWQASGSERLGRAWTDAPVASGAAISPRTSPAGIRRNVIFGVTSMVCLGVLRPGYEWIFQAQFKATYEHVRQLNDPGFFTEAAQRCRAGGYRELHIADAFNHLSRIIMHTGLPPRMLKAADLTGYHAALNRIGRPAHSIGLTWRIMHETGGIPASEVNLRHPRRRGQLSVGDLVDSYQLSCRPVRDLLVRYLKERAASLDYVSLRRLISNLVGNFWKDLETHHPGIDSLRLTPDIAQAWKQRAALMNRPDKQGQSRTDVYPVLFAVRAFYLDLSQWALEDASWAPWVAPCPVRDHDVKGSMKHQRRRTARMHQRTRVLASVLPQLVESVEQRLRYLERLNGAAQAASAGDTFTLDDTEFIRIKPKTGTRSPKRDVPNHLRVHRHADGQALDLTAAEDEAFWGWAIVETLRHSGIRLEELLELTHLALITHTLDSGEVVPLLQIAPSKQDAERLLMVSPELAHVLARVIHRVRAGQEHVPLVARYDHHEKTTGPMLPHLFQRRHGAELRVISPPTVHRLLRVALDHLGLHGPDGQPVHYSPHDFRRIFATQAVAGGLPVHITAKILGHQDLSTTQRYTAIYQDDVLRHYAAFITRRRAERPSEEYRNPTDAEWTEFEQHFTRRKVELGTCARPYGTPCRHEHACLRCPMLRPDPAQGVRLAEIITNLHERLKEATERGWLGEAEGLKISLEGARQKAEQIRRIRTNPVPIKLWPAQSS